MLNMKLSHLQNGYRLEAYRYDESKNKKGC